MVKGLSQPRARLPVAGALAIHAQVPPQAGAEGNPLFRPSPWRPRVYDIMRLPPPGNGSVRNVNFSQGRKKKNSTLATGIPCCPRFS